MPRVVFFVLLFIISSLSYGQEQTGDPTERASQKTDSIQQGASLLAERAQAKFPNKFDSLRSLASVNRFKDSLKVKSWSESLRQKVSAKFSGERTSRSKDSLRRSGMSTEKVEKVSDSLLQRKEALLSEVYTKQSDLQNRITTRYDNWLKRTRDRFNLDSAGVRIANANTTAGSEVNDPFSKLNAGGPANSNMPSLNTQDFMGLGMSKELTLVGGNLTIPSTEQLSLMDMGGITGKVTELKELKRDQIGRAHV